MAKILLITTKHFHPQDYLSHLDRAHVRLPQSPLAEFWYKHNEKGEVPQIYADVSVTVHDGDVASGFRRSPLDTISPE